MDMMSLLSLRRQISELPIENKINVTESLTKVGNGMKSPFYDTVNKIVYAIRTTGPIEGQGVVKSVNNGKTWTHVYRDPLIAGEYHRHVFVTKSGALLIWVSGNRLLRLDKNYVRTHEHQNMYAPLLTTNGIEQDKESGTIVYAEYANLAEKIWKSTDDGVTWTVTHADPEIRHWHGVQRDPYTGDWYAFAGDTNAQSRIKRSEDNGLTWITVAGGDQKFRVCGLQFTEEYIYWCPDYASVATGENTLNRIHRDNIMSDWFANLEVITDDIEGPAYGMIKAKDGRICFWTAAENRERSVIYFTDGKKTEVKMTTNRAPNTAITNAGFTQITKVDDDSIAYVSTWACGYGEGENLYVVKLPTIH